MAEIRYSAHLISVSIWVHFPSLLFVPARESRLGHTILIFFKIKITWDMTLLHGQEHYFFINLLSASPIGGLLIVVDSMGRDR